MLILGMHHHERIIIEPRPNLDLNLTVAELFADGPIIITPMEGQGQTGYRRVGIASTPLLRIMREPLEAKCAEPDDR